MKKILKKEDVGQIDIHKKNQPPKLFLCMPGLVPDECHMMVSQWKQSFVMMPCIGSIPPPGDPKYSPADSLCGEVYKLSTDLGYHTTKSTGNQDDQDMFISARNEIRTPYLNFVRVGFLKISRDIVTNSRDHLTHTKKFASQSDELTRHVDSVQRDLASWIHRKAPTLFKDLFSEKNPPLETDLKRICTKIVHFESKIKNQGIRTGWKGRKGHCQERKGQDNGGVWVGAWFLYTMLSDLHRKTVHDFPSTASLWSTNMPNVIDSEDNPPIEHFVQHVHDSGYKHGKILHPTRHNALHWMGKPVQDNSKHDVYDPWD